MLPPSLRTRWLGQSLTRITTRPVSGQSAATGQFELWALGRKEVTVAFSAEQVVTDAGLLTIRKLDRELGFLAEAASRLADPRSQKFIVHDAERLLVQQIYRSTAVVLK